MGRRSNRSIARRGADKSVEGSYRGPAVGYSHWGNAFDIPFGDGYQAGLSLATTPYGARAIPIAFSCVMLSAKAIALCPASHQVLIGKRWEKSTTSPASRLLRYPNPYQTWSQFILNALATMLFEGEAFVAIQRDNRFAPHALHLLPRNSCAPYVDPVEGEVFYSIGANPMVPQQIQAMAPQRDIIHLRQYCPRHPLIGETALKAAGLALGINVALSTNQAAFFTRMNRPSGILTTDQMLTRAQITELRAAFEEQSRLLGSGGMPILAGGLKFDALGITSQDAQLIEAQRMSIEDVARVMGVPLPLVGDPTAGGVNNTETLINFWLAMGLGSLIENIESSLERAFDMGVDEAVEFDVDALLRTDMSKRIEALAKGVQGSIFTPDEAREKENLPPTPGGNQAFLQKQMVPIDLIAELAAAELKKLQAPPPVPAIPPAPANPDDPDADPDAEPEVDAEVAAALVRDLIRRKCA